MLELIEKKEFGIANTHIQRSDREEEFKRKSALPTMPTIVRARARSVEWLYVVILQESRNKHRNLREREIDRDLLGY